MTIREGLRLFGYPEWFEITTTIDEGFDLLGNTVVVPVVKAISERLVEIFQYNTKTVYHEISRPVASL